ncbi:hypothetical protein [Alkalihalobacillus sp. CinArs1]|uniref:hypothetical protein n=1 Tax=Alkalihalobacillus sp. CinArs1 TaxID=2995314 RepID=UPI0022DDAE28|nr:hypothetical protein [Alkalihalobacillus sp. CinArs1]
MGRKEALLFLMWIIIGLSIGYFVFIPIVEDTVIGLVIGLSIGVTSGVSFSLSSRPKS